MSSKTKTRQQLYTHASYFMLVKYFFLEEAAVEIKRKKKVPSERSKFCLRRSGSPKGESYGHGLRKSNRLSGKYSESWVKVPRKASYIGETSERTPMP